MALALPFAVPECRTTVPECRTTVPECRTAVRYARSEALLLGLRERKVQKEKYQAQAFRGLPRLLSS